MRYVTAVLASIFMFLAVWLLSGLLLFLVTPPGWAEIGVAIGPVYANLVSLISAVLAAVAATYTFRASLKARTGRLYRRGKAGSE